MSWLTMQGIGESARSRTLPGLKTYGVDTSIFKPAMRLYRLTIPMHTLRYLATLKDLCIHASLKEERLHPTKLGFLGLVCTR
ncbi:MAG: hypothetical protein V7K18_16840 [Nostoc sp.]|uniref:hypothetical protein n=1 Tax=Nostoc sp. TaxID=1180 RepID=UPI002FFA7FE3